MTDGPGAVRNDDMKELQPSVFEEMKSVEVHAVTTELARRAARIASTQQIRGCTPSMSPQLDDVLVTFDRQQSSRAHPVVRVLVPE